MTTLVDSQLESQIVVLNELISELMIVQAEAQNDLRLLDADRKTRVTDSVKIAIEALRDARFNLQYELDHPVLSKR